MQDRVPTVTVDDINRLLRREFSGHKMYEAKAMLRLYRAEPDAVEPLRMQAALLKLAGGSIDKLRELVGVAQQDFRDVLAPAEYPGGFQQSQRSGESEEADEATQQADWEQYQAWFTGRSEKVGGGSTVATVPSVAPVAPTREDDASVPIIRIPKVTEEDVERLLRRDFRPEDVQKAGVILRVYGSLKRDPGLLRVRAAILKLAEGSIEKLPKVVADARSDFRNVLVWAETPTSFQASPDEQGDAIRADWEQYQSWFSGGL